MKRREWKVVRRLALLGLNFMLAMLLLGVGVYRAAISAQERKDPSNILADSPWPKYRGDLWATGLSPHKGPQTPALKWTFSTGRTGKEGGIETDPVIGPDGTVYFGANNGIFYALDPETGDIRWVFPTAFDTYVGGMSGERRGIGEDRRGQAQRGVSGPGLPGEDQRWKI